MEQTAELVAAIREEMEASKAEMQRLTKDVRALTDVINPALLEQVQTLRASRMAIVSEVQQSLSMMKDVRKFFLDSTYEEEMTRLERFVRLCRDILQIKREGVFDVVCDAAIRLAIKENGQ